MEAVVPVLALGLVLGVRHAFDADHVVAVTAIVSRERSVRTAAAIGALWGLGHSATIFVVGGVLWVGVVAGLASVAFGALLAYRIGGVGGLFAATPSWTPR